MADPITWGTILIGAGTMTKAASDIAANKAAGDAEERNAAFFAEQAQFAQESGDRTERVYNQNVDEIIGKQVSGFSKAGVDMSGSALLVLNDTLAKQQEEVAAIRKETAFNVQLAREKGISAQQNSDSLNSFGRQVGGAAGTVLTGAGNIIGLSSRTS